MFDDVGNVENCSVVWRYVGPVGEKEMASCLAASFGGNHELAKSFIQWLHHYDENIGGMDDGGNNHAFEWPGREIDFWDITCQGERKR